MKIRQFKYSRDNFAYIAYNNKEAIAIDGGATSEILSFLEENNITLTVVTNTHSHQDHTCGNQTLLEKTNARLIQISELKNTNQIEVGGETLHVHHTPGHTNDSFVFYFENILISGDTLFNGTIGNCFSEDYKSYFNSIKFLMGFPQETTVYAGHDYVAESMTFAKIIEPENSSINSYLDNYNPKHVNSTLKDEFQVNIYLRFNNERLISLLTKKELPVETEYDRWLSVMNLG